MNKVILLGRLSKDVELKYTQTTQTAVASFSIAVNRSFVKQGEERQADFFNITAWNKLAENASKYLKKGNQVAISGRLQTRTWDDEQGKKHYITEIVAEELDFIETRKKEPDESILTGTKQADINEEQNDNDVMMSGDDLPF